LSKLAPHVEAIIKMAADGATKQQVADHFGVSEAAVRRIAAKEGIEFAGPAASSPPTHSISSDDPAEWGDIEGLLAQRGMSLQDWMVVGARVNEWADQRQLRVDLKPRIGLLVPARTDGWRPPPRAVQDISKGGLVALFGDHHAPHHDPVLHEAVCEWLRRNKPAQGILLGDLLDLDAVSRHRANPEWATTMQDCVDAGYGILRAYVQASPTTRWRMLAGNHEDRLRNGILDNLAAVHRLTPGAIDEADRQRPVLSIPHLLRLDELGIEWMDAGGEYAHGQIQITSELAARHGWIAKKGAGTSALATINHLRFSVVIGHTHRQSIVHHTAHSINGDPRTLLGAEAGTLAKIRGGLGYAVAADWQQGFATAQVWPDGMFKLDLATWTDGSLLWRNTRITSNDAHAAMEAAA
jgi:hypothetical protein